MKPKIKAVKLFSQAASIDRPFSASAHYYKALTYIRESETIFRKNNERTGENSRLEKLATDELNKALELSEEQYRRIASIQVINAMPQLVNESDSRNNAPPHFVEESVGGHNIGQNHRILDERNQDQTPEEMEMEERTKSEFRNKFNQFQQHQQQERRQANQNPTTQRLDNDFARQQQIRRTLIEEHIKNIKLIKETIEKCPPGQVVIVEKVRNNFTKKTYSMNH